MPKAHFKRRIRHTPKDMLSLVSNVVEYPVFINLISAVRIISAEKIDDNQEKFIADVGIQYKFISEVFRSQVSADTQAMTLSITRAGHGGAVRRLANDWKFIELKDGSTLIDFRLDVGLKAKPLEFMIRKKFDKAADSIMNSFERRAAQLFDLVGEEKYDYNGEV